MSILFSLSEGKLKGGKLKAEAKQTWQNFEIDAPQFFDSPDDENDISFIAISQLEHLFGDINIDISSYNSDALLKHYDRTSEADEAGKGLVYVLFDRKRRIYGVPDPRYSSGDGIDCKVCGEYFTRTNNYHVHVDEGYCERIMERRRRIENPKMNDPYHPKAFRIREDIEESLYNLGMDLSEEEKRTLDCEFFSCWDRYTVFCARVCACV